MKKPAFQFITGDWKKDEKLSMCGPATRGVWIDLLCAMHDNDHSGVVVGTMIQLSRVARCTLLEMQDALQELSYTKAADIAQDGETITITNRRMAKEYNLRVNGKQQPQSQCRPTDNMEFDVWWQFYPRKLSKGKAKLMYERAVKILAERPEVTDPHAYLLVAVKEFAESPNGQGDYCPHPATWLYQEKYDDDRKQWSRRERTRQVKNAEVLQNFLWSDNGHED